MSDSVPTTLRELLAQRYEDFKSRLTWKLGSSDLANDVLHDTWVHLEKRNEQSGPVNNPGAYLMKIATNLALDRLKKESRYMSSEELDALMAETVDPAPGPAQIAADRDEVERLAAIIEGMPRRRRAIFLAVRVDELSIQEAAQRFGVSTRLVGLELKRAHEYCLAHFHREA